MNRVICDTCGKTFDEDLALLTEHAGQHAREEAGWRAEFNDSPIRFPITFDRTN